jgi:DNA polymerase I
VLKLPAVNGARNTQADTLKLIDHPFVKALLEYRKYDKACTTYLKGFKRCADMNGGKLRTVWRLTGTRTGRLSSGGGSNKKGKERDRVVDEDVVNMQNISLDELLQNMVISDRRWRKLYKYWRKHGDFGADNPLPEWALLLWIFLGFDHSQMELRVLCQRSGDKKLREIFSSGGDPHSMVGHELTGWSVEKIKSDEVVRKTIKGIQFGLIYGLTPDSLIRKLRSEGVTEEQISDDDIRMYYQKYFETFKAVKKMIDSDHKFAEEHGYVETMYGFRRELNIIYEHKEGEANWENQAVNTPIQGTAHQTMLMGMVPLHRKKKTYRLLKHPQLEIHDAIYFRIQLFNMWAGAEKGQYMLEKESLKMIREKFHIDWVVPFIAEPKAGMRFGNIIKLIKDGKQLYTGKYRTEAFVNAMCARMRESEIKLGKELRKAEAA